MQSSIPPIGRVLSFSTSQVDLTHNDDYVVTIVNKLLIAQTYNLAILENLCVSVYYI